MADFEEFVDTKVNRHPEEQLSCSLVLGGQALSGDFQATWLVGDSPDAFNAVENPQRVLPAQATLRFTDGLAMLPPHSVTIVQIE